MASTDPQGALFGESAVTGKYHGHLATPTERASGEQIERDNQGPLRAGSRAHTVLDTYRGGHRFTAYEASMRACGDYHARRRESTRLLERGYLVKDGTLPNHAPGGRRHVDAYRITAAGLVALARLDREEATE